MYLKCEGFLDDEIVKEILSKDYIVKDVTFKLTIAYTNVYMQEDMTRNVAIPKDNPNLIITEDNYGEYLTERTFEKIFIKKLFEMVVNNLTEYEQHNYNTLSFKY